MTLCPFHIPYTLFVVHIHMYFPCNKLGSVHYIQTGLFTCRPKMHAYRNSYVVYAYSNNANDCSSQISDEYLLGGMRKEDDVGNTYDPKV